MKIRRPARIAASLLALCLTTAPVAAESFRDRLPEDEVIYFLLPDRFENGDVKNDTGGIKGGKMQNGFDPTHKGFFHGGDLKGIIKRLDYIQSLGATAIWLSPVFKNKAVQGGAGQESAGYHGYWVTDFTTVDPHLGTEADFKALVDAAHARGMKVYMDIITNHTADVIQYKECPTSACAYRSRADYPYSRRAADGASINPGFQGDNVQTKENFDKLIDNNFAYTPFVPKGEENAKKPAWMNDVRYYHNRGDTTFRGENSNMGDFVGLDDLMTENPRVVEGYIDIYGAWIDKYGIDGYRIDTAKHVNVEFWQKFAPAMAARAKARGIPNFHIFGEVATGDNDPALLARFTRVAKLPSVLDFAFLRAVVDTVGGKAGTEELTRLFDDDALYEGGAAAALRLPTFLGNHDFGRFGYFVRKQNPQASDEEILKRVMLGNALLMTSRGVPTIYSGDEQGFTGDGGDQDAREDMYPSRVASYNDNRLIGTKMTTADSNFDQNHPIYQLYKKLAQIRHDHVALRRGLAHMRNNSDTSGLFAFSRIDDASGEEILVVTNTAATPLAANVEIDMRTKGFTQLLGNCPSSVTAPGSAAFKLAPFDFVICKAQ
jgi:neopullulanase